MIFATKTISKFTNPNAPEEFRNPLEEAECFNTIGIPLSSVIFYEQFQNNPEHPYYSYDGPLLKVAIEGDYERMILCTFDVFHKAMCNYKNVDYITVTPN